MPTSATNTYTATGLQPAVNPESARMLSVKLVASTTYPAGCVLGEVTATPGTFGAYASGASDGTQNPRMLLKFGCTTDASGNIAADELGGTVPSAPAYYRGTFRTDDLPQSSTGAINATAMTNSPQWKLMQGTVVSGLLNIG